MRGPVAADENAPDPRPILLLTNLTAVQSTFLNYCFVPTGGSTIMVLLAEWSQKLLPASAIIIEVEVAKLNVGITIFLVGLLAGSISPYVVDTF